MSVPRFTLAAALAVLSSACSTVPAAPPGLSAGAFTQLSCASGRPLQARYAEDGRTIRVRAMHGAVELERRADGSFAADDYLLRTTPAGLVLEHKGKPESKDCRPA